MDSSTTKPLSDILTKIRPCVEPLGDIKVAKIILLQKQAIEISNEISQEGFIPVIVHDDIDIFFTIEAMEQTYNDKIEILVLSTKNENLLPLFGRARELGKEVVLLQNADNLNKGLRHVADMVLSI
ncbi:MAG: NYN domain-containing protein [Candidatus Thorarchaeota archaeon]